MAKNIRWQIPFVSDIDKTKYRIDIYDEGTFTPVQLAGGPTPFVTNENNDTDFFAPVRSQTGTIQVCTAIPGGGTLSLNDILPANNIARPVRLVSISGSTETIEWQGFLSCEAYSQDYIGIPQVLDIPVISVLEAMDSVEVELDENMAFKKIMGHVAYAMKAIETQSGMTLWSQVYISSYIRPALTTQYFYNNVYFDATEQVSGDNIVVEVHSISCKKILEQVAKFFGSCWRESGQNVYLETVGKSSYSFYSFTAIYNAYAVGTSGITWLSAAGTTANLADQTWMGTGHKRSVAQGKRRVKVNAGLKDFECDMALMECPLDSLVENPDSRQAANGEVHVNTNETFYNLAEHKHYLTRAVFPTDLSGASLEMVSSLSGINYNHTIFWETELFRQNYYSLVVDQSQGSSGGLYHYITSFMAWWRDRQNQLQSGLMICGTPKLLLWSYSPVQGRTWNKYALTSSNYLFKQRTPLIFSASKGCLKIDINTLAWSNAPGNMPSINYGETLYPTLTIALQFGDKWAYKSGDDYLWSSTFHTIDLPLEHKTTNDVLKTLSNWSEDLGVEEGDGLYIKIPEFMVGVVTIYVYHEVNAICLDPYTNSMFDVFINKLDVEYVLPKEELRTDRGSNVYAADTSEAFKDEEQYDVELASDAHNTKLATMLWDDSTTPAKLITLGGSSVRPESDLLSRLAAYYGSARQRLELEVKHPTTVLPLLKLNGIGDSKVYLPLSESRDWKADSCKLTCFETPN